MFTTTEEIRSRKQNIDFVSKTNKQKLLEKILIKHPHIKTHEWSFCYVLFVGCRLIFFK